MPVRHPGPVEQVVDVAHLREHLPGVMIVRVGRFPGVVDQRVRAERDVLEDGPVHLVP